MFLVLSLDTTLFIGLHECFLSVAPRSGIREITMSHCRCFNLPRSGFVQPGSAHNEKPDDVWDASLISPPNHSNISMSGSKS